MSGGERGGVCGRPPTIWVDADACPGPVREVIWRASARTGVEVVMVANTPQRLPFRGRVRSILVPAGADVADDRIVEEVEAGDLVVTADVPLAERVVQRGAVVVTPRGGVIDEDNAGTRRSERDFLAHVREVGLVSGGPRALGPKEVRRFAAAFDRELTRRLRRQALSGNEPVARDAAGAD